MVDNLKPILFNTDMVRAILDGRKTVTRRVLKTNKHIPYDAKFGYSAFTPDGHISVIGHFDNNKYGESIIKLPYQNGDILYVRETWGFDNHNWLYKADFSDTDLQKHTHLLRWHPSIHMPQKAARIFLHVKNVRVESLQDIDDDGVLAEGLEIGSPFDDLWNSTIKKSDLDCYGWNVNPWVWVIEFERIAKIGGDGHA